MGPKIMDYRRMAHAMGRGPRPKTLRCQWCKEEMKISARGRVPRFCSKTCRQRDYEKRKWSRPALVEALAHDLASIKVREFIRKEILAILWEFGLITDPTPPPTPKTPRMGSPLRAVK
jgi:hypothetical protein